MPHSRLPEAAGFAEYETLLLDVSRLLEQARQSAGRAVNAVMTATYRQIGRRIVEQEQKGSTRASYGEELEAKLARDLTARFGRGFSRTNVFQMRQFFLAYRAPLSWFHYVRLLTASATLPPTLPVIPVIEYIVFSRCDLTCKPVVHRCVVITTVSSRSPNG